MISTSLKKIPYLSEISAIARKSKVSVWLVGGFLRDVVLKRKKDYVDFDFCVERKTKRIAQEFAKKRRAKCIVLDKEQESYRVIVKKNKKLYTYDFSKMRGKDFEEDLRLRDFSINTLAVCLNDKPYKLIDKFDTKKDLKKKVIRVLSEGVFEDDPLRIIRGFAFMVNLGFRIEKKTFNIMASHKYLLSGISGERLGEEIYKILAVKDSYPAIRLMSDAEILDDVIPHLTAMRGVYQGKFHHLGVWEHSLETLKQFERLYNNKLKTHKDLCKYLEGEVAQGRTRAQVIKLGCLLHDIGKPKAKARKSKRTIFHTHEKIGRDLAEDTALRLRLSFKEKEMLKKLIFWHLRPGYLADQIRPTKRAIYHFFRDTQEEGAGVIILSLSDWQATRGPMTSNARRRRHEKIMLDLLDKHFKKQKEKPLPKLLNGYDVMRTFKLKPSVIIGKILKAVDEAQHLGKIHTKTEAYKAARQFIVKAKGKKAKKK